VNGIRGYNYLSRIPEIILASTSPQRRHILEELEIPYQIVSREVDEITGETPKSTVLYNARLKAEAVAREVEPEKIILAADTVLARGEEILGKPADTEQARAFLASFSGNTIHAYTGLTIVHRVSNSSLEIVETAEIIFRSFSQKMIDWYVGTGEPLTRAGAFGISKRGEILVKVIHGSYSCIAGLPKFSTMVLLNSIFKKAGISQSNFFPPLNSGQYEDIE